MTTEQYGHGAPAFCGHTRVDTDPKPGHFSSILPHGSTMFVIIQASYVSVWHIDMHKILLEYLFLFLLAKNKINENKLKRDNVITYGTGQNRVRTMLHPLYFFMFLYIVGSLSNRSQKKRIYNVSLLLDSWVLVQG